MSEPLIPAGAFAAMKAAQAQPAAPKAAAPAQPQAPKAEAKPVAPKEPTQESRGGEEPPAKMTPAEKKIWKLKADGEEFEYDASDEERIKRDLMKIKGADKRFETAAQKTKQAEEFLARLRDPAGLRQVLEDPRIGVDIKKFAKDLIWEEIQESQMTQEERDKRELDRYKADEADRTAKDKSEKEQREFRERQSRFEQSYEQKITKALELGGVPKTHEVVAHMAEYMFKNADNNIDLSPEEIVKFVQNDIGSYVNALFDQSDGDSLLNWLGESRLEKLRAADLKRLRSTQSTPFQVRTRAPESQQKTPIKKLGGTEWKEDLVKSFLARPR